MGKSILKRSFTAVLALIVLGLLAGDRITNLSGGSPTERLFSKYKEKHALVRREIQGMGEELREVLKTRERAIAPRLYIALMTELARLKAETSLISSWERGTLSKEDSRVLMADSLMVLEYLHMTNSYAKAILQIMREEGRGRSLASSDAFERAARDFEPIYQNSRTNISVFEDTEVMGQGREAGRLAPIARLLFQNPTSEATLQYRVRFFARYSENIIEKNRDKLIAFQKSLTKSASAGGR